LLRPGIKTRPLGRRLAVLYAVVARCHVRGGSGSGGEAFPRLCLPFERVWRARQHAGRRDSYCHGLHGRGSPHLDRTQARQLDITPDLGRARVGVEGAEHATFDGRCVHCGRRSGRYQAKVGENKWQRDLDTMNQKARKSGVVKQIPRVEVANLENGTTFNNKRNQNPPQPPCSTGPVLSVNASMRDTKRHPPTREQASLKPALASKLQWAPLLNPVVSKYALDAFASANPVFPPGLRSG
jgi:hypothetical protein